MARRNPAGQHLSQRQRQQRALRRRPNSAGALAEGVFDTVLEQGTIDPDDYLYRSLTRSGRGDNLPQYRHDKMLSVAIFLSRTNPVAKRLINLLVEFVLGEGVHVTYGNDRVREVGERHWTDPYNDWDRYNEQLFRAYLLTGELLMPIFPNPVDGHMRVGVVKSADIAGVYADPENWRIVRQVAVKGVDGPQRQVSNVGPDADRSVTPPDSSGDGSTLPSEAMGNRLYTVLNFRDGIVIDPGQDAIPRPALFWSYGNDFGERGISILYPVADFLDLGDQLAFSELERQLQLKNFIWDVTVDGANQNQLDEMAKLPDYSTAPPPGAVRMHNERVIWQAIQPNLNTGDATNGMDWFRNHALGGVGIPRHWFVEGEGISRATAQTMAEPTRKMLSMMQRHWRNVMTDVLQLQMDYAVACGTLPAEVEVQKADGSLTGEFAHPRELVTVNMPDLAQADTLQVTQALQALTASLVLGQEQGYVTVATARQTFLTLLTQVGVEIDMDQEAENADKEKEQADQAEIERLHAMRPPPPTLAAAPPGANPAGAATGPTAPGTGATTNVAAAA